jgi:hypothetical protein
MGSILEKLVRETRTRATGTPQTGYGGLYTPTRTTNNVHIVNPKKPLLNYIYK